MKKNVLPKSCYIMGIIGGIFSFAYGLCLLLQLGNFNLIYLIGYVFFGGMILFMTTTTTGKENRQPRMKLLGIFLLLVLSYLKLPPLSQLAGALAIPLFTGIYRRGKHLIMWFALLVVELFHATTNTIFQLKIFGANEDVLAAERPLFIAYVGTMLLVNVLRIIMLFTLFKNAKDDKAPESPDAIHHLR